MHKAALGVVLGGLCSVSGLLAADPVDPFAVYPLPKHRYEAMTEAEQQLRNLEFARAEATIAAGLEEHRGMKRKAKPVQERLTSLQSVFDGLRTRDQLSRDLTAHPLCVEVTVVGGEKRLGVPVVRPGDTAFADTDRPIAFINRQLEQSGQAYLVTNEGAVETLIDGKVEGIVLFDSKTVREAKQKEFAERWARMQEGDLLADALNWYEAAKFAYRWSLDGWVAPLLEEALKRNKNLVPSVQEDLAADYVAKVIDSLNADDIDGAKRWLAYMAKHFPQTASTQQARALVNKDEALLAAAVKTVAEQEEKEAATASPEETTTEEPVATTSTPPTATSSGDPAKDKADAVMAEAVAHLSKAQNMPPTRERDILYKKTEKMFSKAKQMYIDLGLNDLVLKANSGRYACKKMRRF